MQAPNVPNQSEINHLKFMLVVIMKFLVILIFTNCWLFLFRIVINITCYHFLSLPFANAIWCIVPEGVGAVSAEGTD